MATMVVVYGYVESKRTDRQPRPTSGPSATRHTRTCGHHVRHEGPLAGVHRNQRQREQSKSTSAEGWADKTKMAVVRLP